MKGGKGYEKKGGKRMERKEGKYTEKGGIKKMMGCKKGMKKWI